MSQFHNSKLSSQTRTLSKGAYPVDLHYKSFGGASIYAQAQSTILF